MVTFRTGDGTLVPEPLRRALVQNAHRRAELTAAALKATGLFESEPPRLPAAFLLELSAVLELGCWEKQDLRRYLNTDLPTFSEAAGTLAARCLKGPPEFEGPDAAPLSLQVLQVRVEQLAWEGPELLSTDVVINGINEDAFIDALAEFVWNYRHELAHLVHQKGGE